MVSWGRYGKNWRDRLVLVTYNFRGIDLFYVELYAVKRGTVGYVLSHEVFIFYGLRVGHQADGR